MDLDEEDDGLHCPLCDAVYRSAVMMPCCAAVSCEPCAADALAEGGGRCWRLDCRMPAEEQPIPDWEVRGRVDRHLLDVIKSSVAIRDAVANADIAVVNAGPADVAPDLSDSRSGRSFTECTAESSSSRQRQATGTDASEGHSQCHSSGVYLKQSGSVDVIVIDEGPDDEAPNLSDIRSDRSLKDCSSVAMTRENIPERSHSKKRHITDSESSGCHTMTNNIPRKRKRRKGSWGKTPQEVIDAAPVIVIDDSDADDPNEQKDWTDSRLRSALVTDGVDKVTKADTDAQHGTGADSNHLTDTAAYVHSAVLEGKESVVESAIDMEKNSEDRKSKLQKQCGEDCNDPDRILGTDKKGLMSSSDSEIVEKKLKLNAVSVKAKITSLDDQRRLKNTSNLPGMVDKNQILKKASTESRLEMGRCKLKNFNDSDILDKKQNLHKVTKCNTKELKINLTEDNEEGNDSLEKKHNLSEACAEDAKRSFKEKGNNMGKKHDSDRVAINFDVLREDSLQTIRRSQEFLDDSGGSRSRAMSRLKTERNEDAKVKGVRSRSSSSSSSSTSSSRSSSSTSPSRSLYSTSSSRSSSLSSSTRSTRSCQRTEVADLKEKIQFLQSATGTTGIRTKVSKDRDDKGADIVGSEDQKNKKSRSNSRSLRSRRSISSRSSSRNRSSSSRYSRSRSRNSRSGSRSSRSRSGSRNRHRDRREYRRSRQSRNRSRRSSNNRQSSDTSERKR